MHLDEATRILSRLKAGFPSIELDEEQSEVLLRELALLHDARMLDIAVTQIIQRDERFPSIARIRATYKTNNEIAAASRAALARAAEQSASEIPEWVHVWEFQRRRTQSARVAANTTSKAKPSYRPPVRMRDFPQQETDAPDAYTFAEYGEMLAEWVAAGSPSIGSALELAGAVA